MSEPRLNFHIGSAFGGSEPFLPVHPTGRSAPDKKFASFETVGGCLTKPPAIAVDGGFKLALFGQQTEKEVFGERKVFRVSAVISLRQDRHFDLGKDMPQVVQIGVGKNFLSQCDHPQIISFIHGDVGPPVHGNDFPGG